LRKLFTQVPGETYNLLTQQLMMDVVLESDAMAELNVDLLKRQAQTLSPNIKVDNEYEPTKQQLKEQVYVQEPAAS